METKKITPLFFFLSLGTVVTLIMSVAALLNVAFETLNHVLPDVLTDSYQYGYMNYSYEGVRSALALLIIIFPVYMVLEHFWSKQSRSETLSTWNAILRKWAIYLILFLASVTIITDLVVLVKYFVGGEITARFLIKIGLALAVALKFGYYYIRTLRGTLTKGWRYTYAIGGSLAVLALVIWCFSVVGSPMNQRKLRIDQRRIDDLQSIQWQVISFWQQKGQLPETLKDLANPISSYMVPQDPEFQKGKTYEYRVVVPENVRLTPEGMKNLKTFELCATFSLPMPKGWVPGSTGGGIAYPMTATRDAAVSSVAPYPGTGGDSFDHEAGRACFTRTIDPDIYPPYPKTKSL